MNLINDLQYLLCFFIIPSAVPGAFRSLTIQTKETPKSSLVCHGLLFSVSAPEGSRNRLQTLLRDSEGQGERRVERGIGLHVSVVRVEILRNISAASAGLSPSVIKCHRRALDAVSNGPVRTRTRTHTNTHARRVLLRNPWSCVSSMLTGP